MGRLFWATLYLTSDRSITITCHLIVSRDTRNAKVIHRNNGWTVRDNDMVPVRDSQLISTETLLICCGAIIFFSKTRVSFCCEEENGSLDYVICRRQCLFVLASLNIGTFPRSNPIFIALLHLKIQVLSKSSRDGSIILRSQTNVTK